MEDEKEVVEGAEQEGAAVPTEEVPPEKKEYGFHKRLKEKNPDLDFENSDAVNDATDGIFNELLEENNANRDNIESIRKANEQLIDIFEAHPEVANFMDDLVKGASPEVALARNFDLDDMTPQDGDPDYEAWNTAATERRTNSENKKKFNAEVDANKVESSKVFQQFAEKRGWDEATMNEFLEKVDGFLGDLYKGKVTSEFLETIETAMNRDGDVENAKQQATIDAKNEKIEAVKKNQKSAKGDGMPHVTGSGKEVDKEAPQQDYMDSLLSRRKRKQVF